MTSDHASTTAILERIAAELTPRQFDAWTLHHHNRMSTRRIAEIMGITPATVREHLAAADKRIARIQWEGEWPWT